MNKDETIEDAGTGADAGPLQRLIKHPYHCPLDGEQLREIDLGFLLCLKCKTQFLPTQSKDELCYQISWGV